MCIQADNAAFDEDDLPLSQKKKGKAGSQLRQTNIWGDPLNDEELAQEAKQLAKKVKSTASFSSQKQFTQTKSSSSSSSKTKPKKETKSSKKSKSKPVRADSPAVDLVVVEKGLATFQSVDELDLFFAAKPTSEITHLQIELVHQKGKTSSTLFKPSIETLQSVGKWLGGSLRRLHIYVGANSPSSSCNPESYLPLLMKLYSLQELNMQWDVSPSDYAYKTGKVHPRFRISQLKAYLLNMNKSKPLTSLTLPYLEIDDSSVLKDLCKIRSIKFFQLDWPMRVRSKHVVQILKGLNAITKKNKKPMAKGGFIINFAPGVIERNEGHNMDGESDGVETWFQNQNPHLNIQDIENMLSESEKMKKLRKFLDWRDPVQFGFQEGNVEEEEYEQDDEEE